MYKFFIHPYAFVAYRGTTLRISGATLPFTHTPLCITEGQHMYKWSNTSIHPYAFMAYRGTTL